MPQREPDQVETPWGAMLLGGVAFATVGGVLGLFTVDIAIHLIARFAGFERALAYARDHAWQAWLPGPPSCALVFFFIGAGVGSFARPGSLDGRLAGAAVRGAGWLAVVVALLFFSAWWLVTHVGFGIPR